MAKRLHRSLSYGADDREAKNRPGRTSTAKILSSFSGSVWNLFSPRPSGVHGHLTPEHQERRGAGGQDKQRQMWMQACYNAVVLTFVFIAGCVCFAVYCVLKPFLQPLLWALLVGLFLHPFKQWCSTRLQDWVIDLERRSMPLSLALLLSPFLLLVWLTSRCEQHVLHYRTYLLLSAMCIMCLWLAYILSLPLLLYTALTVPLTLFERADAFLCHASPLQLFSYVAGFVVLLLLSRRSQHTAMFQALSVTLWFLVCVSAGSCVLGRASLPVVAALFLSAALLALFRHLKGTGTQSRPAAGRRTVEEEEGETDTQQNKVGERLSPQLDDVDSSGDGLTLEGPSEPASVPHISFSSELREEGDGGGRGGEDDMDGQMLSKESWQHTQHQTSQIFLILIAGCFLVSMWRYPLLLILLLLPVLLCAVLKRVLSLATPQHSKLLVSVMAGLKLWLSERRGVLFPEPLPTLLVALRAFDKRALQELKPYIGSLVSACILSGLLLSVCVAMVLLLLGLRAEMSHYATITATAWNSTLASQPWLAKWSFQDTAGAIASQGYMQIRAWLSGQMQSLVSNSSSNTSQLESRVMELLDRLYHSYVTSNVSATASLSSYPSSSPTPLGGDLSWPEFQTVLSVLKSLWAILSSNLAVAFSVVAAILELLLNGGTALLNVLVFITALFYLLCFSEDQYLPVGWVVDLLEQEGASHKSHYAHAFSRAIRSVFHASLQKALFYGLYTWLLHTLFHLPVAILPSVLAAVAGAVPFIGPYWVAMPAVLEAWLLEGKTFTAIALASLSLLPSFFVDSIFYREIKGSHPYLTALAVAGGIYFAGLQGALLGPLLLCCLLFVVDCSEDMLRQR